MSVNFQRSAELLSSRRLSDKIFSASWLRLGARTELLLDGLKHLLDETVVSAPAVGSSVGFDSRQAVSVVRLYNELDWIFLRCVLPTFFY